MAVMSPLAAKAQTGMTLSITANPLGGGTSPNVYTGQSNVYIDPYDTDTLYVYATVNGTAAPSASYVDGLQYVYFNVNAVATGSAGVTGTLTAATPGALFGGGAFNQTTTSPGAGAQGGALGTIGTSPSIVVGTSNGSLGSIAKPRAAGFVYDTGASNGSNVVVSGTSVSFLVETLTYVPNSTTVNATPSAPGAANSLQFNVSTPNFALFSPSNASSPYFATNYAVGMASLPTLGSSPGATNTASGTYNASAGNVHLTNAIPGDVNLDGSVDINDYNVIAGSFNTATTSGWTAGDLTDDGSIDINDFNILAGDFNQNLGSLPSGLAGSTSLIAPGGSSVPEPTTGLLLSSGMLLGLRRRRRLGK
jgi:hypothetical protein